MKTKYLKDVPDIYNNTSTGGRYKSVAGGPTGRRSDKANRALICPQAQTIIAKFGGPRELARTLKACSDDPKDHFNPSTIYRWMYPREVGGTDGEIPGPALKTILRVARIAGVMLTSEDIYPHLVDFKNQGGDK